MDDAETIPYGYCHCGCGEQTPLWEGTNTMRGVVKGDVRKYCPGHYHRRDPVHEFRMRVGAPDEHGCWPWRGMISAKGYGMLQVHGRSTRAHRFSYELHVGPIPAGLEPDHLCRNRACVNPTHLEAVTHQENSRRSTTVRLTADDADAIRRRLASGEQRLALAAEYGVAPCTISAIKHRRIWRDT